MLIYKPIETHTHTIHSDGDFTVHSLLENAQAFGYQGLILSDHNTDSGYQEVTAQLQKKYMPVIRAIEWTTFFGHMLVIGTNQYVDWRFAKPDTIDQSLREIQEADGVVGIAHPFSMGGVLYTGGYFEFQVHEWDKVSFIEVFSKAKNETLKSNARALAWWYSLLNEGKHLAITSGRDWHRVDQTERPCTVTYVGCKNGVINESTVKEALRKGRTYVTFGITMDVYVIHKNRRYELSDTLPASDFILHVILHTDERRKNWEKWNFHWNTLKIIMDGKIREEISITSYDMTIPVHDAEKWFTVGIYGTIGEDDHEQILAYTSPFYIRKKEEL